MGKLDKYKINLKGMREDSLVKDFILDNQFFSDLDGPEVTKGNIHVSLKVRKTAGIYELAFHTEGVIQIPCDRCLEDMEQPILTDDKMKVKLGMDYSEEGDIVVVPEDEGTINIAWFMYEFIVLNIPMKHTHAPGKCNKSMIGQLNKHLAVGADDEILDDGLNEALDADFADDVKEIDSRWNDLKKILDNN